MAPKRSNLISVELEKHDNDWYSILSFVHVGHDSEIIAPNNYQEQRVGLIGRT